MNRSLILTVLLFILFGIVDGQTAANETKVSAIRDKYRQVTELILEHGNSPELSSVFVTEIKVNKHNAPYPAVGIFDSVILLYYTYGDREKNPYPNRLIKATVTTHRSAEKAYSEYLFSNEGLMIFAYVNENGIEKRGYFDKGRLIKFQHGEKVVNVRNALVMDPARSMTSEAWRIQRLFSNSL